MNIKPIIQAAMHSIPENIPQYSRNNALINCLPILLGIAAYFLVVGPAPLEVQNIAWLKGGDPGQFYLGWSFFCQSSWSFPLGSNPAYGLELSSSIFFSDSIPLLALLFKLLSPVLPATFQYFGLWLLLSFVLQAWFAWKLVGLITRDVAMRLIASAYFIFSPTMLWLLHGHYSLFGHWLILAALYLCFSAENHRRQTAWLVIAMSSSLVHPYLLAMILCLWLSDLSRRLIIKNRTALSMIKEIFVILAGVGLALRQAGFFLVKSGFGGNGGFGYYRLNILSPINPGAVGASGFGLRAPGPFVHEAWSYILPVLPYSDGSDDLNFLGIGILLLIVATAPFAVRRIRELKIWPTWAPLLSVLFGLMFYALSNNITIGSYEINFPIPSVLSNAAQMLRCSVRMFWPIYYLIYAGALYVMIKSYKRKTALVVLSILLALQVADTSAGWLPIRHSHAVNASTWQSPFKSNFWEVAAKRYRNIRVIYPGLVSKYEDVAYFAATHGMATDAAYLARYDLNRQNDALREAVASVRDGRFDSNSIYLIFDPVAAEFALSPIHAADDLIACVDGFLVIAPRWKQCPDCPQVSELKNIDSCKENLHQD